MGSTIEDTLSDDACISVAAYRRIAAEGVSRRINGVTLDGEPFRALNNVKWAASIDEQEVGRVTSAIYSPRLEANIGFCWLPAAASREGHGSPSRPNGRALGDRSWRCRSSTPRS